VAPVTNRAVAVEQATDRGAADAGADGDPFGDHPGVDQCLQVLPDRLDGLVRVLVSPVGQETVAVAAAARVAVHAGAAPAEVDDVAGGGQPVLVVRRAGVGPHLLLLTDGYIPEYNPFPRVWNPLTAKGWPQRLEVDNLNELQRLLRFLATLCAWQDQLSLVWASSRHSVGAW
jgi:hypothetical protein